MLWTSIPKIGTKTDKTRSKISKRKLTKKYQRKGGVLRKTE